MKRYVSNINHYDYTNFPGLITSSKAVDLTVSTSPSPRSLHSEEVKYSKAKVMPFIHFQQTMKSYFFKMTSTDNQQLYFVSLRWRL